MYFWSSKSRALEGAGQAFAAREADGESVTMLTVRIAMNNRKASFELLVRTMDYPPVPSRRARLRPVRPYFTPAPPPTEVHTRVSASQQGRASRAEKEVTDAAVSIEVRLHARDVGEADRQSRGPPRSRGHIYRV